MGKIYLLLLMPFVLMSQIINENFSDLPFQVTNNTKAYYVFDTTYADQQSQTLVHDYSGNSNDLTVHGWASEPVMRDSSYFASPLLSNSGVTHLDGSTTYLSTASTDVNPGLKGFTLQIWIYNDNQTANINKSFICKGINDAGGGQYRFRDQTNPYLYLYDDALLYSSLDGYEISQGQWLYLGISCSFGGSGISYRISTTRTGVGNSTVDLSGWDSDITPTQDLFIGTYNTPAPWLGAIAMFKYDSTAFTYHQLKDDATLDPDWFSKNGGTSPEYQIGNQGIYADTIYTAIPDTVLPSGYQFTLTWQDSVSGGVWTERSYNFTQDFSGDSLYFGISGTSLKVYVTAGSNIASISRAATTFIDNVLLTTSAIDDADKGYKEYPKYPTYPRWK